MKANAKPPLEAFEDLSAAATSEANRRHSCLHERG
jgi:hypothetical protein